MIKLNYVSDKQITSYYLLFNLRSIFRRWYNADLSRYYKQEVNYYIYSEFYDEDIKAKKITEEKFLEQLNKYAED